VIVTGEVGGNELPKSFFRILSDASGEMPGGGIVMYLPPDGSGVLSSILVSLMASELTQAV